MTKRNWHHIGQGLGLLSALLLATSVQAAPRVYQKLPASQIAIWYFTLTPGRTYTFNTTASTAGGDPVVHLLSPPDSAGARTEVARDDDGGGGVEAGLVYTASQGGTYQLLIRARNAQTVGSGTLYFNAARMGVVRYGGYLVSVDPGTRFQYETAGAPGGSRDTRLYALDCGGTIRAYDDNTGVAFFSQLTGLANICSVLVGTAEYDGGLTNLYVNDHLGDGDGDGVGAELEAALGTCDGAGTNAKCSTVVNTRDTDRDGLIDGYEVFGRDDAAYPQPLPLWGANPRHKDVFVEVDYDGDLYTTNPIDDVKAFWVAVRFALGSADDLLNFDRLGGVRIHLDVGREPDDPAFSSILGSWGGASAVYGPNDGPSAVNDYRRSVRKGIFRYAFAGKGVGGQAFERGPSDGFTWGAQEDTHEHSFAHELGHTLGLHHYGHDKWGELNCKPNYPSIMNYALGRVFSEFSQGDNTSRLNPNNVAETAGAGYTDPSFLTGTAFAFLTDGRKVDLDRDELYFDGVRAPITWATWRDCNAMVSNRDDLDATSPRRTSPDIVRVGSRLYAFHVTSAGQIRYRSSSTSGPDANGSCPGGDRIGDRCTTWSAERSVPIASGALALTVSALGHTAAVELVFRASSTSDVRVLRATGVDSAGVFTGWTNDLSLGEGRGDPDLSWMRVDRASFGTDEVVAAVYLGADDVYRWAARNPSGSSWTIRTVRRADGTTVSGSIGAGLSFWPHRGTSADVLSTTCGAFVDPNGKVEFYCYDQANNRWLDLTASAFPEGSPSTQAKPGLAYHVFRAANGLALGGDVSRGQFFLTTVNPGEDSWPALHVSRPLGSSRRPAQYTEFAYQGKVDTHWTTLEPTTGVPLYEDALLSAMKGLWLRPADSSGERKLEFLPLADGTASTTLIDGNDYQVMERGICLGLKNNSTSFCGSDNVYGY